MIEIDAIQSMMPSKNATKASMMTMMMKTNQVPSSEKCDISSSSSNISSTLITMDSNQSDLKHSNNHYNHNQHQQKSLKEIHPF